MLDFALDMTVDRLAADISGDRIAVVSESGTLRYSDFDAAVNHVAEVLRAKGVCRDDCVAVIVPRSPELLVAIHGILRAGAAYVPIDPEYPLLRIRTVIEDCGARVVVARTDFAEIVDELGASRVEPTTAGADLVEPVASPGDLAYVIYTSGSTGQPKGVMVEHRSVVNRLRWMQRQYPLDADDVILQKTSVTFDVSVWELLWWAMAGARVAMIEPGAERDPRKIVAAIQSHGVTVMHFVPSMLGSFLDQLESQPDSIHRLTSLRMVFCSGEALTPALVERFNRVFGVIGVPQLVNLYGPTEATVDVSYFDCPSAGTVDVVPIGKPIDNTTLLVLDERRSPCPVGVAGELNIGGVCLARGYRGRPDLTADSFIDDQRVPGGRLYRTGDLARWRSDGNLEFLGRIDDEVKVRGNRVSLGEVQATMESCPGVRSAVAIAEPSDNHGSNLIGYFVGDFVSLTALRDHLARRLPGYMIPTSFVELTELPLTTSGKVNRRALARPVTRDRSAVAPRTPAEAALVDVFGSVLNVDCVGVHDNFFTIGGDSILALAVRSEAEKRGIAFDIEELFARPTVAELAESNSRLTAAEPQGITDSFAMLPLIDRASLHDAEDAFPATGLQLGMLFHSIERAESTMYKDVFRYRVAMPWYEQQFTDAFDRLVQRHPALRSSFELKQHSVPLQVVRSTVPRAFDAVIGASDVDVKDYMAAGHRKTYDISSGPLYSLRAFVREDGIDLAFAFHHALLDGWSVVNLIGELLQDYLVSVGLDVRPINTEPYSSAILAEYVRAEMEALENPAAQEFWRAALSESCATSLESYVVYEAPTTVPPIVTVLIPQWLEDAARKLATASDIPIKSLLLSVHCIALQRISGEADVTTGVVTHGRPGRVGAEAAAGLFLNTIPIRLNGAQATCLETVEHIARFERASHRYRRYPLQAMQSDAGRTLFKTAFNFVNYHHFAALARATGVELLDFESYEQTNFALLATAGIDPRRGRLFLRVNGDPVSVTAAQAREYAIAFTGVLAEIVRSPDRALDVRANEVAAPDVTQLVAQQAAEEPDSVALVDDSRTWTYAELDGRADRIAAGLLAAGMPPGARVGVMLDRSPELIATVLGVLKAGAAVVPLDVSYPNARIDAMIRQARPFRVISDISEVRQLVETPEAGVLPAIDPNSAAYVLFTSGSTGAPKGVSMPHRALANLITWQNRQTSGAVGSSTLQFAPLSFDVSFQEIFSTLCGGGTLRLVSEAQRKDSVALVRLVADEGIERVFLPFVALQAFAEAACSTCTWPASLRVLISSGEQLRVTPEIRRLCTRLPGVLLENQYGPTETHVAASYPMTGSPDEFPMLPPIGTAIEGATLAVIGPDLRPLSPGNKGEICIGGRCVASGYEGQPDLTAERFVRVGDPPVTMYRTGDVGRELPSGDIVCLGRIDTQVKVRGFRVECAEVEIVIKRLYADVIRAAAVVARRLHTVDSVLVAYLVGDSDAVTANGIRSRLRSVLPEHMIPDRFVWLDELPLTPSGKRDDKTLRELPLSHDANETEGTPPRNGRERAIADIMAEFAGAASFAADTNFFDAGGTSIGAMRVIMAISRSWGVEIPLDAFVAAPTAADLARLVTTGAVFRAFDPLVALRSSGDRPPLFLIHPIGGNVLCYLNLAKHLPADLPIYALQAAGAEPGAKPLRTMSDLAVSYIAAIRRVRPEGPYNIGGWSFGGYVAAEMARQLADDELARLILIDTIVLTDSPRPVIADRDLIIWFFMELLSQARGSDASKLVGRYDGMDCDALFDSFLGQAIEAKIVPAESSPQLIRRLYDIFHANYEATMNYRHTRLDRDITLLKSTEQLPTVAADVHRIVGSSFTSPTNGWERLMPRSLSVIDVAGDHLSMMSEPNVIDVASKLEAALR
ncbi:amino acid adenylation enzyme/thioester reductase family protein [Mycobacterium sp. JS623]|uniref:amino acid adenylation domain-containing protein n=1 Tax=Mycobacterium sp. JS623 TaxID=212767 RepID=UPI0002A5ADEB|nr:non-ribosomal peptide synthetase [Mycobacterium sp. JS623]AGB25697.1 amino acid adenylation enzyme/thioester reductase family protein [Mycobacterium sp. JS623]